VGLACKCNPDNFDKIYQEHYKNKITHEFIRSKLGLPDSVRLKLNGTFTRWLILIDEDNCIYRKRFQMQTALWLDDDANKYQYVSIFPNFIKRYCRPSLCTLEYVSCHIGKGENFYRHIDDPEAILNCEDSITMPIMTIEKSIRQHNHPALLNARYTEVYNKPLAPSASSNESAKQYQLLYDLILVARQFFGMQEGVLPLVNAIILL